MAAAGEPPTPPPPASYGRVRRAAKALFLATLTPGTAGDPDAAWAELPEAARDAYRARALEALNGAGGRCGAGGRAAAGLVKRPRSAFLFFLARFRQAQRAADAGGGPRRQRDVCAAAGAAWRAASAGERAPYEAEAAASRAAWAARGAGAGTGGAGAAPAAPPAALPIHTPLPLAGGLLHLSPLPPPPSLWNAAAAATGAGGAFWGGGEGDLIFTRPLLAAAEPPSPPPPP